MFQNAKKYLNFEKKWMKRFYFLFLLLITFSFEAQKKNLQTDIQKILDGIIVENNYSPKQNHIFIVLFYYHPNDSKNYYTNIVYYSKSMGFGGDDEENGDKSWGIFDYKGFEVFFISRKSIDISKEVKFYKKITDEEFQNKNGYPIEYDPIEYNFFVDKNFKYLPLLYLDSFPKDFVEHRKLKIEKILRHSYYKK
jgi:hypothetical protein